MRSSLQFGLRGQTSKDSPGCVIVRLASRSGYKLGLLCPDRISSLRYQGGDDQFGRSVMELSGLLYRDLQFVVPFSVVREDRAMPLVAGGVSERMYPDLQGGIQKLFATVAQHLVFAGSCTYEIEYLFEKNAKPKDPPVEFHLQQILAGTVDQHHRRPIQFVLPAAPGATLSFLAASRHGRLVCD